MSVVMKDVDWLVITIPNKEPKTKEIILFGLKMIVEPTYSSDHLQMIA